jgi:hypothetical protein
MPQPTPWDFVLLSHKVEESAARSSTFRETQRGDKSATQEEVGNQMTISPENK